MKPISRLSHHLSNQKATGKKTFIPFITAGYPTLNATKSLLKIFAELNVDAIELGVPFSDPMADGPVIQKASEVALANHVHLNEIFELVREFRTYSEIPVLLMGYYNPIYCYGIERFVKTACNAGVDGLLIVDLPPEEANPLKQKLNSKPIDLIYLLTPTSTEDRIKLVAQHGSGFVYYVSYTGITGSSQANLTEVHKQIKRIKKHIQIPINIGFGISTAVDAKQFAPLADGIIVGSALLKKFESEKSEAEQIMDIKILVEDMLTAV